MQFGNNTLLSRGSYYEGVYQPSKERQFQASPARVLVVFHSAVHFPMLNFNQLVRVVFTSTDSRSIVICGLFSRKNKSKCKEMPLLVLTPFYFRSLQIMRIIYIIT